MESMPRYLQGFQAVNIEIRTDLRSRTKATAMLGRDEIAVFWRDTLPAHAKIYHMMTAPELRAVADALDRWAAT
jgi:hypothetical protein